MKIRLTLVALSLAISSPAMANHKDVTVALHKVTAEGLGAEIGTVTFSDTAQGLKIVPHLTGLPPGEHGFHIHQNPSCSPADKEGKMSPAESAGGHLDPSSTGKHEGPNGSGHLGDLPVLKVNADGSANSALLAPRLTLNQIEGHALMIHEGGDNFSDTPKKLGGGGTRIACGVVKPEGSHS